MLGAPASSFTAQDQAEPGEAAEANSFGDSVRGRLAAALEAFVKSGDVSAAEQAVLPVFDEVVFYATDDDASLFVDAAFARRLVLQFKDVDDALRRTLIRYLRDHGELVRTLVFLIDLEEKLEKVFDVLDRLRQKHGDRLEDYANLAAAICVVHDQPLQYRIGGAFAQSEDPLEIFEYFARNEGRMAFGVRKVPPELLTHVVDCTARISEMQWALNRYAGHSDVGSLFFEIDYDYDHFQDGKRKRCLVEGFSLASILKHGGVCAEQAYFATSVGKAIGVPTAYALGAGGEVSHAWVGFLQTGDGRAGWNFDSGRYEAYQGIRGSVIDPQTRRSMPDSFVALLAETIGTNVEQRRAAIAITDAAIRLIELEEDDYAAPPPQLAPGLTGRRESPRLRRPESQLKLIELALTQNSAYAPAWLAVRDLAQARRLTIDQKIQWSTALQRLCGSAYPDFSLEIVSAMIGTVDDVDQQNALWNAAFASFRSRHDLAAQVRLAQGRMWEKADDDQRAGQCYEDIVQRFVNAGPFVLDALERAEKLLRAADRDRLILELYGRAWRMTSRPDDMHREFSKQSNWFRIGTRFARRLEQAGLARDAQDVWRELGEHQASR